MSKTVDRSKATKRGQLTLQQKREKHAFLSTYGVGIIVVLAVVATYLLFPMKPNEKRIEVDNVDISKTSTPLKEKNVQNSNNANATQYLSYDGYVELAKKQKWQITDPVEKFSYELNRYCPILVDLLRSPTNRFSEDIKMLKGQLHFLVDVLLQPQENGYPKNGGKRGERTDTIDLSHQWHLALQTYHDCVFQIMKMTLSTANSTISKQIVEQYTDEYIRYPVMLFFEMEMRKLYTDKGHHVVFDLLDKDGLWDIVTNQKHSTLMSILDLVRYRSSQQQNHDVQPDLSNICQQELFCTALSGRDTFTLGMLSQLCWPGENGVQNATGSVNLSLDLSTCFGSHLFDSVSLSQYLMADSSLHNVDADTPDTILDYAAYIDRNQQTQTSSQDKRSIAGSFKCSVTYNDPVTNTAIGPLWVPVTRLTGLLGNHNNPLLRRTHIGEAITFTSSAVEPQSADSKELWSKLSVDLDNPPCNHIRINMEDLQKLLKIAGYHTKATDDAVVSSTEREVARSSLIPILRGVLPVLITLDEEQLKPFVAWKQTLSNIKNKVSVSPIPYSTLFGANETQVSMSSFINYMKSIESKTQSSSFQITEYENIRSSPPKYYFQREALSSDLKPIEKDTFLSPILETLPNSDIHIILEALRMHSNHTNKLWSNNKDNHHNPYLFQIYFGPSLSGAPFHLHHIAANFIVEGYKHWSLVAPPSTLYSNIHPLIELFNERHLYSTLQCKLFQGPGEVLVVPKHWSHQVLNLQQSLGFAIEVHS